MDPNLRFPQAWELEVWTHAHACEDVKFCKKSLEVIWVTHGSTGGNEGLGTANSHGERAASLWRQHIPPHGSTGLHPQQELNAPPNSSDSTEQGKSWAGERGHSLRSSGSPAAAQGAGGTWHKPLWPAESLIRTTPAANSSGLTPSGEHGRGAMGKVSKQAQWHSRGWGIRLWGQGKGSTGNPNWKWKKKAG